MNENNGKNAETSGTYDEVVNPWVDYWMKLCEQNTQWTQALMAGTPEHVDPTTIRKQWLGAMSESIESYMRSPAFLEGMKQNAEMMTATKTTSELAKREMARQAGVPHIEDISGLYERLQTDHEVVMHRLNAIDARLASIEKQLSAKATKSTGNKK